MKSSAIRLVLTSQALALACLLPASAFSAQPAARAQEEIQELSDVLVTGEKPTRKVADLIPWLRRLLGQYTYDGYVDLAGKGSPEDRRNVRGVGLCVGFGVAPGVQCEINVHWPESRGPDGEEIPGGTSHLAPAMILYGVEPDDIGIRYLQVDNRGLAEGSTGFIIGDTATFRAPCVDAPPGCQRITRITAQSDSKLVEVQVDTEVDYELTLRYRFQMTRVKEVQSQNNAPADGKPANKKK